MNIIEMKERRKEILDFQAGLLDLADEEKRSMTDDEDAAFKTLDKEFDQLEKDNSCSLTSAYSHDAELSAGYPFPFTIQVTHGLFPGAVIINTKVKNFADHPIPFGLGFHNYFSLGRGKPDRGQGRG